MTIIPKRNKKDILLMEGFIMNPLILDDTPYWGMDRGVVFFISQKSMLDHAYIIYTDRELDQ